MKPAEFPQVRAGDRAYLDNAATSLLPDQVLAATNAFETGYRANVARGIYPWAEEATQAFERARAIVARTLDADASEIVFTAGATAALNLAADLCAQLIDDRRKVLLSELDHHSNIVPWQLRFGADARLGWVECDDKARLRLDQLERLLAGGDYGVLALTHASNVTGEVLPIGEIAAWCRQAGALLVVDGAQHLPHAATDPRELGADFYAFSGHKCNAPMGVGVLWARAERLERLAPPQGGGGMVAQVGRDATSFVAPPHRFEAGTPPVAAAIGLAAALGLRLDAGAQSWRQARARMDALDARLRQLMAAQDGLSFIGDGTNRGAPIVAFNLDGLHAHDVCQLLGEQGICARGGHHCAQPLMRRLGLEACVRFSLGPHLDEAAIARVGPALAAVAAELS